MRLQSCPSPQHGKGARSLKVTIDCSLDEGYPQEGSDFLLMSSADWSQSQQLEEWGLSPQYGQSQLTWDPLQQQYSTFSRYFIPMERWGTEFINCYKEWFIFYIRFLATILSILDTTQCGRLPSKMAITPASWYPCSCVTPSFYVWVGSRDLNLTNGIWQKWQDVIFKIRI